MIDHALLLQHLAQAEERIASGVRDMAKQQEAIAKLIADGHVTEEAKSMLAFVEQAHATDVANYEHVKKELARTPW
jgi:hypothetical protein